MEGQDKTNTVQKYIIQSKTFSSCDSNPQLEYIHIQQEYPLIERYYHQRHRNQYQNLLETNINVTLKKKLFGFTKSAAMSYKTNNETQMVLQIHPLKGRTIMPLQKFQQREEERQRAAQIQQTKVSSKVPKHNSSSTLTRPAVDKYKGKSHFGPIQQLRSKKMVKVDESVENLLLPDSEKDLIREQTQ